MFKKNAFLFSCIVILIFFNTTILQAQKEVKPNDKYIYFTFDDGPLAGSEHIDSIALNEQIKFNVFVVGRMVNESRVLKSYLTLYENNPFIDVYNHSYSHANNHYNTYYKNPEGVLEDIIKNETELHLQYKIVRLPGGNIWRIGNRKRDLAKICTPAADLLVQHHFKLVGWDIEWEHDAKTSVPKQSVNEIVTLIDDYFKHNRLFTPNHLVILLHDEMFQKRREESELKQLIDILKGKNNYIFEHIRYYPTK